MITYWVCKLGLGFASWIAGLLPSFVFPDASSAVSDFNSLLDGMQGIAGFFPWDIAMACATLWLTVYFACMAIRFLRMLVGYIPLFGGNG